MKNTYSVSVLGFDQTEKIVLASIFGLAARRSPRFIQAAANAPSPDIYLADAADGEAVSRLRTLNPDRRVPTILIGDGDHGTGWPVLKRPLQWTRLFKAFDLAVMVPAGARPATAQAAGQTMAGTSANSSAPTLRITPGASVHGGAPSPTTSVNRPPPPQATAPRPNPAPRPPTGAPATTVSATAARANTAPPTTTTKRFDPSRSGIFTATEPDNVMVVDDSLAVREFMRSKLEPFAFRIDYASSGEEAIGLTATKHYTCIFLDVVMPGIDGYQVCKMIKARKSVRSTAIVMLTSKSSPFDKIRGAMAGCDAYLTKPVDEEKLLETIAKFLPTAA